LNTTEQPDLIPMEPGDLLRQARLKLGYTEESVAQAIKVRPDVVLSIEKGDTAHIPPVYLKGYIRNYARQVGIERNVIEQHLSQAQGADPVVQSIFKEGPPRNKGDRWFKASSYVVASVVVIALVWQFTNEAVRFSQGDPLLRNARVDGSPSLSSPREDDAQAKSSAAAAPASTHLQASIASMNMPEEQANTNRPLVAEGAWAAIGSRGATAGRKDSMPRGTDALEIITSADSWVEIFDRNGEKMEMDLLRAGSKRTYQGAAPFQLLLGRASSVEVFHNGKKVDLAPYIRGNVARFTLDAEKPAAEHAANPGSEAPASNRTPSDKG